MPVVNSNRQIVYFVLPLKNFESSIRPFTGPRMDGEERVGVMVSSSLLNLRMGSTTEVVARLCIGVGVATKFREIVTIFGEWRSSFLLKVPTSSFTLKNLLTHYATRI